MGGGQKCKKMCAKICHFYAEIVKFGANFNTFEIIWGGANWGSKKVLFLGENAPPAPLWRHY